MQTIIKNKYQTYVIDHHIDEDYNPIEYVILSHDKTYHNLKNAVKFVIKNYRQKYGPIKFKRYQKPILIRRFKYNDGGRKSAGYKGTANDCVTRAISIATKRPYKEIYNLVNLYSKKERISKKFRRQKSNARLGVKTKTLRKILEDLGWTFIPTMKIGSGCEMHLNHKEVPKGVIIVSLSKHICCVINGVINDTYDCSRNGRRCVYGYWVNKNKSDENTS